MTEMRNYSGNPIDAAWKTAPWNDKDGETIAKGTQHNGEINMTELPDEVNDKRLTDKQEQIIRTAVRNPEYTTMEVEGAVGCSSGYAAKTLAKKCPDWYETSFKPKTRYGSHAPDKNRDDSKDTADDPAEIDNSEHIPEHAPPEAVAHAQTEPDVEDTAEWQTYAVVGLVAFILGLLWGGRNE